DVILTLASASVLLVAIYFLLSKFVTQMFDKKLEAHKVALKTAGDQEVETVKAELRLKVEKELEVTKATFKQKTDAEVERLKTALGMESLEHQVRFTKLHDMMSLVLIDLFGGLQDTFDKMGSFVSPFDAAGGPDKD